MLHILIIFFLGELAPFLGSFPNALKLWVGILNPNIDMEGQ